MTRWWSPRAAGGAVLAALAAFSAAATVVAAVQASDEARAHERTEVALVADDFASRLQSSLSALRGADGMAIDGTLDADEFDGFAASILRASDFMALAFSEVVAEAGRTTWEATTGHEMQDLVDGAFVSAAPREQHVVVRHVHPLDERTQAVIGFDLLSDPVRATAITAATDRDDAVVGPISLATSGEPGVFLTQAVHQPNGVIIGFVSAGIAVESLLGGSIEPRGLSHTQVWIDGIPALPTADGRPDTEAVTFDLVGHSFTLEATDGDGPDWLRTVLLAACTSVLFVMVVASLARARRWRERNERTAEHSRRMAELREALSGASDVATSIRLIVTRAGAVLDADWTVVRHRTLERPGRLVTVMHDVADDVVHEIVSTSTEFEDMLPLDRCMTAGEVLSARRGGRRRRLPEIEPFSPGSSVCAPLSLGADREGGALGFGWRHSPSPRRLRELSSGAQLIAQLAGRALERAAVREVVQQRVERLSEFARRMSTVRSTAEIEQLVERLLPELLDVATAAVGPARNGADELHRSYRAPHSDSPDLHLVLTPAVAWTPTLHALAEAVIELVQGAWVRTTEQEQEHQVLQRLQASLLLPPPDIEGLAIAGDYRSALATVDIGGDWYSIVERDDVVHLLVGDVAGHGPGAVALMAETKTILRHLLSNGTPVAEALQQADIALRRRRAYASVIAVTIDKHSSSCRYLNAGHPAPILDGPDGPVVLDEVHRPWLGVEGDCAAPTEIDLPVGARLLLYTDGLVEDRRVPLDDSIRRLAERVTAHRDTPAGLVERLVATRTTDTSETLVDDDIAVIAVARTSVPQQ